MPLRFVAWLLVMLVFPFAISAAERAAPNVIVFLADDLGYSDLGCYGGEIETPNLDRLAANGLRFSQFYNTARCWPTRAGILTGYYAQQVRRDALPKIPGTGGSGTRPAWAKLLPEILRQVGYRNYHSGKWHVDGKPLQNGFDHSYSLDDHDRFFSPKWHTEDDKPLSEVPQGTKYYATSAIAEHAIRCLKDHSRNHSDKPFFSYVCFTSPHFPLHALPEDIAKYRDRYLAGWDQLREARFERQRKLGLVNCDLAPRAEKTAPPWNPSEEVLQQKIGQGEIGRAVAWTDLTDEQKQFQAGKMAIHAAMVDRMDQEIGRVLEQLKSMNAVDNTLIFFLSDNGASAEQLIRGDGHDPTVPAGSAKSFLGLGPGWSTMSNAPFRMHKSWVHEGGISTPLIVHWPAGISEKGGIRHLTGHVIDLLPTIVDVAKTKRFETINEQLVPTPPGVSLTAAFAGDTTATRQELWWYHSGNRAIRIGDWKLVSWGEDRSWELFNLKTDRSESHDLAKMHPEKVKELEAAWQARLAEFHELASRDLPKKPAE